MDKARRGAAGKCALVRINCCFVENRGVESDALLAFCDGRIVYSHPQGAGSLSATVIQIFKC